MIHRFFKHTFFLAVILALVAGLVWSVAPVAAASASISCSGNNAVVTFSGFASAKILGSGPGLPTGWLFDGSHPFSGPGTWTGVQVRGDDVNAQPVTISLGSITCPSGGGGGSTGGSSNAPPLLDSDGDGLIDINDPCPHDPDPNAVPDKDGYCPKDERAARNGSQDSVVTFNTHGTNTQSIWMQDADGRYYKAAEWAPELLQYAGLLPPGTSWDWPGLDGRPYMITYQGDGRFEGETPDGQGFWFQRPVTSPPGIDCEDFLRSLRALSARIDTLNGEITKAENEIGDLRKKLEQAQQDRDEFRRAIQILEKYAPDLAAEDMGVQEITSSFYRLGFHTVLVGNVGISGETAGATLNALENAIYAARLKGARGTTTPIEWLKTAVVIRESTIETLQDKISERQAQRDNIINQRDSALALYNTLLKKCGQ